jgi:hypothetical protein
MKKIYYLFAFVAAAFALASCHPLDNTYKKLDAAPAPAQTITYSLAAADYGILDTTIYAHFTHSFKTADDAKLYIPRILNSKYGQAGSGSNANISFATQLVLADSVYKDLAYTLVNTDYNNSFHDYSAAQVLTWLPKKYPEPADNQLAVLTLNYFSGNTSTQTLSYLYMAGAWQQIYMITPAQYALAGHAGYNQFSSTDDANLVAYLNAILKADVGVSVTVKTGDVKYVSFNYYNTAKKITSQRVVILIYNGTNWVMTGASTLGFVKNNNGWVPDPTVYYTLNSKDTKLIAASAIGTDSQRTDLGKYGDFSGWAAADVQKAIILVLTTDFKTPTANIDYKITYLNYTGGADVATIATFQWNGTAWVVSK